VSTFNNLDAHTSYKFLPIVSIKLPIKLQRYQYSNYYMVEEVDFVTLKVIQMNRPEKIMNI
jgi:hypothetical protein